MCLAVPGKILTVDKPGDPTLATATVDFQGTRVEASLAVTPDAVVGDWVLVHAGFTLTVMTEEEAAETWETLRIALGEDVQEQALEGHDGDNDGK